MQAAFHRQQSFDVLQDEEARLMTAKHLNDDLEQGSTRITNALFLAGAAEGLAGKTGGEQIVGRDVGCQRTDVALVETSRAESVSIDAARLRIDFIGPDRFDAAGVGCHAKPANAREQLDRFHHESPRAERMRP